MDYQDIPQLGAANIQIFKNPGTWNTWDKPRNASMVQIICVGGGAGGGGGFVGAAGAIRGGGGGGGSSAVNRLLIPAMMLPGQLWIQAGTGGLGVSSGTGGSGGQSYVSLKPGGTAVGDLVMQANLAVPVGGVTGTVTTAGTGGAAGTIPIITTNVFTAGGQWNATVGVIGSAAGAVTGAIGVATAAMTNCICGPGAGGASMAAANTEFAGGLCTGTGLLPNLAGGLAGAGAGPSSGQNGISMWEPFMNTGGSGGGANNATAGKTQDGGNGSFGSGGGGGGATTTSFGTSKGGNGGPGIVIITCW